MKTLKNILIAGSLLGLTSVTTLAEGKGGGNGFVDAATKYEKLSQQALADGNIKDAEIYHKLALIKLAASKASANGEDFSWDEYHALQGQLSTNKGGKAGKNGKHGKKGGGGFNAAAERYKKLAEKARQNGNEADAKIYDRMAQIKVDAAAHKGDKPFSWDEYHKLNGQLSGKGKKHHHKHGKKGHHHKHDKKGKGGKGGNGFLKAAEEYTAKANEAMQNGDEETAEIYTKLAAMKREAAAAAANGKGYDWTEYFKLKKQLKK